MHCMIVSFLITLANENIYIVAKKVVKQTDSVSVTGKFTVLTDTFSMYIYPQRL